MDRQTELLEKEDPRYYAIDRVNTGIGSIATAEFVNGKILGFGLPSSTALFLSLALQNKTKLDNIDLENCFNNHPDPQGIYPENHKLLFDLFELMIAQIIFSYTALESFSNIMIPISYTFDISRINPKKSEIYDKTKIERYIPLNKKLDIILPEILLVEKPSNDKIIWNNFNVHKSLRDRIIHLKSVDIQLSGIEQKTIWGDLLRNKKSNFVDNSYKLIGKFLANKKGYRWLKKFPYKKY